MLSYFPKLDLHFDHYNFANYNENNIDFLKFFEKFSYANLY